eukprot:Ihof_evm1s510 gene=Ihof_evmTU1s510
MRDVHVRGVTTLWCLPQQPNKGLQVALDDTPPHLIYTSLKPKPALASHILSYNIKKTVPPSAPLKEEVAVGVVQALTAPLVAAMKAENVATTMFWNVVAKVKTSLSAMIPLTVTVTFRKADPTPPPVDPVVCEKVVPPANTTTPSISSPAALRPEDREQEILKQLCTKASSDQPLIFSARSIESYVAARKASEEESHSLPLRQPWGVGFNLTPLVQGFVRRSISGTVSRYLWVPMFQLSKAVENSPYGFRLGSWVLASQSQPSGSR